MRSFEVGDYVQWVADTPEGEVTRTGEIYSVLGTTYMVDDGTPYARWVFKNEPTLRAVAVKEDGDE